jgi:hypothetical protein
MGFGGGEEVVEALLQAVEDFFNAPAQLREPYSRANGLLATVPPVAKLADDFDAESRKENQQTTETVGRSKGGGLTEQLPPEGTRLSKEDAPAAFREGGKVEGAVLTAPYLADSPNWLLKGPYLTKHYGPGKELTTHIKVGRAKAYLYAELLVLRDRKTANEE